MLMPRPSGKPDGAMAVVCVAGGGENGLAIVRALGRLGVRVAVLGYKGDLNLASRSRYCQEAVYVSRGDDEALVVKLKTLSSTHERKAVLFFDNDQMIVALASYADELEKSYLLTIPLRRAGGWINKRVQEKLAEAAGLRVPKSWFPTSWNELDEIERASPGRLLAKPMDVTVGGPRPFKIVMSQEGEAMRQTLMNKGLASPEGLIVQEYIVGPTENIVVSLAYAGNYDKEPRIATGIKVRQSNINGGVMAVGRAQDLPEVRELTTKFLRYLDYRGIIGIEFKREPERGELFFIEASFRTELFHSIGWKSGVSLPALAYEDLAREIIVVPSREAPSEHYWINFQTDVNGLMSAQPKPRSMDILKPYFLPKEWAIFAVDDMRPWARSVWAMVSNYSGRLLRKLKSRVH